MDKYKALYERISEEFQTYQSFAENQIQILSEKNMELERNQDALTNIIEISKYINLYLSDENLIPMINDMIIGILGVTYSSIYLSDENTSKLNIKATNLPDKDSIEEEYKYIQNTEKVNAFVLNTKESIFGGCGSIRREIHSLIGVPIKLMDKFLGYIIIEHTLWNFFNYEHVTFVSSIANQIAIAIENNFLYKKLQESAKRDPLLDIYNRKYFYEFVCSEVNKNKKFAIIMIDIDDFKIVNDTFGHQFGDEVLIETCRLIKSKLTDRDIIARYGGEEIVIYMDRESCDCVKTRVEEIKNDVSNNVVKLRNIKSSITASFGIAYYPENGKEITTVINNADECSYIAKKTGKNRVVSMNIG